MDRKTKVLFITNVPSPYRVDFFNNLGKEVNLTVLYQKERSSERNINWSADSNNTYKSIFLKGISTGVDNAFCPNVIKYLDKSYDVIIICGISSPTEILAIQYCKMRGIDYCLEGDGAFLKESSGLKDKLKSHLIRDAKLYFSTGKELDKYYLHYGANPNKIYRYHFSSVHESDVLNEPVSFKEKEKLKKELGIVEDKIVLAVGRFIPIKGFDILLKASKGLPKNIGVYIVGDEPTEDYLKIIKDYNLTNIYFKGFKRKDELEKFYKSADVFVFTTREDIWGLVVNEAMSYGLPVVSTDRSNAGLELIKNGYNGYIIPMDSIDELQDRINISINNSHELSENSLNCIKEYTIENMVRDHIRALEILVINK